MPQKFVMPDPDLLSPSVGYHAAYRGASRNINFSPTRNIHINNEPSTPSNKSQQFSFNINAMLSPGNFERRLSLRTPVKSQVVTKPKLAQSSPKLQRRRSPTLRTRVGFAVDGTVVFSSASKPAKKNRSKLHATLKAQHLFATEPRISSRVEKHTHGTSDKPYMAHTPSKTRSITLTGAPVLRMKTPEPEDSFDLLSPVPLSPSFDELENQENIIFAKKLLFKRKDHEIPSPACPNDEVLASNITTSDTPQRPHVRTHVTREPLSNVPLTAFPIYNSEEITLSESDFSSTSLQAKTFTQSRPVAHPHPPSSSLSHTSSLSAYMPPDLNMILRSPTKLYRDRITGALASGVDNFSSSIQNFPVLPSSSPTRPRISQTQQPYGEWVYIMGERVRCPIESRFKFDIFIDPECRSDEEDELEIEPIAPSPDTFAASLDFDTAPTNPSTPPTFQTPSQRQPSSLRYVHNAISPLSEPCAISASTISPMDCADSSDDEMETSSRRRRPRRSNRLNNAPRSEPKKIENLDDDLWRSARALNFDIPEVSTTVEGAEVRRSKRIRKTI